MPDKILVVDDEPDILRVVTFSLKKWGYEVITAVNGQEGLDKIEAEKPDLVLLDAGMPVMNGFEMLEELRGNSECKNIPVIMLTAHSDPRDIDIAHKYGILEYVTKPFDPIELRGKIANAMSHSK
ncbi:MAG: response regulator [Planctomycetaceae bacterium]|nr:response regulator [Planctomycetaceae bacterium]